MQGVPTGAVFCKQERMIKAIADHNVLRVVGFYAFPNGFAIAEVKWGAVYRDPMASRNAILAQFQITVRIGSQNMILNGLF